MTLSQDRLTAALEATWPPLRLIEAGPWLLRDGDGGGKRVSAATVRAPWHEDDLPAAEEAMRLIGQRPLFRLSEGDARLGTALAARGYSAIDPTGAWLCPVTQLTDRPVPPVTVFDLWEPLAIMREIWAHGDIGPARLRVMARAAEPKTALFGRIDDRPAGAAFVAIHDRIAVLHALEILPAHRRKGLGAWMMRGAAHWARSRGAGWVAVLCTARNDAANGLYAALRMTPAPGYHYRIAPGEPEGDDQEDRA